MKRICLIITVLSLLITTNACVCRIEKDRTYELLDIHSDISPQIEFKEMKNAKIIMFSDLHRGMGKKDVFIKNKKLFRDILEHYNNEKYTLVLIGDNEEGWGFQRDNIPIILDNHSEEIEIEKKFAEEDRYFRVYGNHDDYYRGNLLRLDEKILRRIYPAITFSFLDLKDQAGHNFNIFITHGCQGQWLHDAGDHIASTAVYVKYAYLLELFSKKFESEKKLVKNIEDREKELKTHELTMFNWALQQKYPDGKKKFKILVAGHTHIPVFNSNPYEEEILTLIKKEVETEQYMFFNDVFEGNEDNGPPNSNGTNKNKHKLSPSLKKKLLDKLNRDIKKSQDLKGKTAANNKIKTPANPTSLNEVQNRDKFYFNTGCGFHSKIYCIEISDGKIYLKALCYDEHGNIDFNSYINAAELKDYVD